MTAMEDRQRAFENKYAYDEELRFRVTARAVKLMGLWASHRLGLDQAGADAYAADLVDLSLGDNGLARVREHVLKDLVAGNIEASDYLLDKHMEQFLLEARRQILSDL